VFVPWFLISAPSCRQDITANLASIRTPLFAVHGGRDGTCQTPGAREVVEKAGTRDTTLREFVGAGHELFEDQVNAGSVMEEIVQWLASH
jgi:alpha-beta hydrolase superfamily lysophospholipase